MQSANKQRTEDLSDRLVAAADFAGRGILTVLEKFKGSSDPDIFGMPRAVLDQCWKDFGNHRSHPALFSVEMAVTSSGITVTGFSGAWANLPEAVEASPVLRRRVEQWISLWASTAKVEVTTIRDPYAVEVMQHPIALCAENAGMLAISQSPYAPMDRAIANLGDIMIANPAAIAMGIIEGGEIGTPRLFPLWTALLDEPGMAAAAHYLLLKNTLIPKRDYVGHLDAEDEAKFGASSFRSSSMVDVSLRPPCFSRPELGAGARIYRAYVNANGVAGLVEIRE